MDYFKLAVDLTRAEAAPTLAKLATKYGAIMDISEDGLPDHKKSGYAERLYEQADLLRKQKREDDLMARFKDDAEIEGRKLNHEAHVDDRRESNEAWDRMQEP